MIGVVVGRFGIGARAVAVAIAVLSSLPVAAAELRDVLVERRDARYFVESVSVYDAPLESMFHVLSDYDNFERVSSVFTESAYIEPAPDGTPRAYTRLEGCVLFFCRTIERIDRLTIDRHRRIVAVSEPEPADFAFSRSEWRFERDGERTVVHYRAELEPGFWMPPLIGPYFMKRRLTKGAVDAIDRVEVLAQEHAAEQ